MILFLPSKYQSSIFTYLLNISMFTYLINPGNKCICSVPPKNPRLVQTVFPRWSAFYTVTRTFCFINLGKKGVPNPFHGCLWTIVTCSPPPPPTHTKIYTCVIFSSPDDLISPYEISIFDVCLLDKSNKSYIYFKKTPHSN